MSSIAVDAHLERAKRHRKVGDALRDAGDEWAAVCHFYSAYHVVRYALRTDPIFDDTTALQRLHRELTPDVAEIARHHGRGGRTPREWGINDAVVYLYRPIAATYHKLHQASVAVRYESGIGAPDLGRVDGWLADIWDAHEAGNLRAPS